MQDLTPSGAVDSLDALAAGILIDPTIVRAALVPATVAILGRWNWWLPDSPARILRVKPATAGDRGPRR